MVDEYISKYWKFGVYGGNFPEFRLEGGSEAAEGGRGVQLCNFTLNLAGDEFAFQVWPRQIQKFLVKNRVVGKRGGGRTVFLLSRQDLSRRHGGGRLSVPVGGVLLSSHDERMN